ncbi:MAG: DUF697 domain-containing protein [Alphaproteobacteria bacterium]|nr:DUF697 domain-containing protein [Alphaproteobacteria bacterium]
MFQQIFEEIVGQHVPESEREAAAQALAEKCGYAVAALTLLPLPGSEVIGVMPIHVGMVMGIGQIYGEEVTRDNATELLLRIGATVGLSLGASQLATTAAKVLLPGLGGLLGAPLMYASTIAIGTVAREHFQGRELSRERMKQVYKETVARAKKDFRPEKMRSAEARGMAEAAAAEQKAEAPAAAPAPPEDPVARLRRLKALLDEGLIEQSEYDATKERVLSEI